jgi:branched-chain amino acid transport system substrate-binding protein
MPIWLQNEAAGGGVMRGVTRHGKEWNNMQTSRYRNHATESARLKVFTAACFILLLVSAPLSSVAPAEQAASTPGVEVAAALSLTGDSYTFGQGSLEGIQLAIEEANADGTEPRFDLKIYDDRSTDEGAREAANQIVRSRAALVLGPAISTASLAAGPVYATANLPSLTTTATSDLITRNATTFRVLFKNSEQGEMLSTYIFHVLGARQATVIVLDNGYGHTVEAGFRRAAERMGIDAHYYILKTEDDPEQIAQCIVSDRSPQPIVFATLDGEGARILPALRRLGVKGPFLGGDAFGDENFSGRLTGEPEEQRQPGYFSEGLYGISPMILDSANADILSFAERFRARFGHDPVWFSTAGYDAASLAVAALRAVAAGAGTDADIHKQRMAALNYLLGLTSPDRALSGLLGPLSFDEERGRKQAIRIGRFSRGHFESAPLQIVPVATPDSAEISSEAVFEMLPGQYARLQQVVYTGVYLNEISNVDPSRSSFGADFYLWLRFAGEGGPGSADPTDINFPNVISGGFDPTKPSEQGEMANGTVYKLWRVQGEFRNGFDLHRFPFDRQTLSLPFFNARAAADKIVYVLDKRTPTDELSRIAADNGRTMAVPSSLPVETLSIASGEAFRELSQWEPLGARERRENLLTLSSLGDPRRTGVNSYRELSGFLMTVELRRNTFATLTKTLLPLFLMTLIMYASLYFPAALVKEKVTVTVTGTLSGAVLLSSINTQLGGVGYTVAVEYVFYIFFVLSLLCIVAVLGGERLRARNLGAAAAMTDRCTRIVFLLASAATLVWTWVSYHNR